MQEEERLPPSRNFRSIVVWREPRAFGRRRRGAGDEAREILALHPTCRRHAVRGLDKIEAETSRSCHRSGMITGRGAAAPFGERSSHAHDPTPRPESVRSDGPGGRLQRRAPRAGFTNGVDPATITAPETPAVRSDMPVPEPAANPDEPLAEAAASSPAVIEPPKVEAPAEEGAQEGTKPRKRTRRAAPARRNSEVEDLQRRRTRA